MDYVTLGPNADHVAWCPKLIAPNHVAWNCVTWKQKCFCLNVADNADGFYIYLYTALAVSTTGGII